MAFLHRRCARGVPALAALCIGAAPVWAQTPSGVSPGDVPAAADAPTQARQEPTTEETDSQASSDAAPNEMPVGSAADGNASPATTASDQPRADQAGPQGDVTATTSPDDKESEIVVLGSTLPQAAGSVQVIREKQLARFEYDDPTAALLQVPGVYMRQEDGIGLRPNIGMRGGNPDRSKKLTLMEDGILFGPAPYSAPAGYFFPLLTRMTELRVIKGPSAIGYGPNTVGGAIDFISRPIPYEAAGAADVAFGDFGYAKAHVHFGSSNEQFGFLVEGVRLGNSGFAQLPSGADTGSTRNEWMVKTSYVVDPQAQVRNEFALKLTYTDEVSNETYLGQTDDDFRVNPYNRYAASALDQMKHHRTGIALTHVLDMRPERVKLRTTIYRNDYQRVWRKLNRLGGTDASSVLANPYDPTNEGYYRVLTGEQDSGSPAEQLYIGPNDRTFVSQGVQSTLTAERNTGPFAHKFEAGVRLHNDQIRRQHTEDAYKMVEGQLVFANLPTLTTTSNRASTVAVALHVTDALTYQRLTLTPGVRAEFIQSETIDFLNGSESRGYVVAAMPGTGAFFEVLPGLGVLGGVYRGFSPPAPGGGSPRPEYSVNYEAGARFVRGALKAEAIAFYNDYSNLTDICTLSSGCVDQGLDQQFNAGAARIYGLEALVAHEIPLPAALKLPISVAYTFTQGQFASSFQSADPIYGVVVAGDAMPYLPDHQANFTAGLEHNRVGVNGTLSYVGPMRERAGAGAFEEGWTTDEQTWLDLSAYLKPLPWLTVYANLRNVTGEAYIGGRRPYGARTNAPRWFQLGAKASF